MYDVMVKSRPEGLHCQVPMCRKNFQTIKFCQTFFYTLVPENDVSETTAFGKSYIYNQERMRLINQERMSRLLAAHALLVNQSHQSPDITIGFWKLC